MTKREAAEILKQHTKFFVTDYDKEAIEVAIVLIETEEKEKEEIKKSIERLEKAIKNLKNEEGKKKEEFEAYRISDDFKKEEWIKDIIRKNAEEGWVPTKKRLPEKEGVYDVTVINGKNERVVCTWQFLGGKHLSGIQTYVDGMHYWANNYNGDPVNEYLSKNVVAWRKRPEPYVEKIKSEKNNSWIPVEERLPDSDEIVLVQVSGKPNRHIELVNTCEFAEYDKEEGWMLENFIGWKNPKVEAWMRLPDRYKK